MLKTFKHSGDLGDIIYGIHTMELLGGGILYLDITGGIGELVNPTHFTQESFDYIKPLLITQPYIHDVKVWIYSNGHLE